MTGCLATVGQGSEHQPPVHKMEHWWDTLGNKFKLVKWTIRKPPSIMHLQQDKTPSHLNKQDHISQNHIVHSLVEKFTQQFSLRYLPDISVGLTRSESRSNFLGQSNKSTGLLWCLANAVSRLFICAPWEKTGSLSRMLCTSINVVGRLCSCTFRLLHQRSVVTLP
jgi:hypothetical protein